MPWNPLEDPVDKVDIAGRKSPGIATIKGAGSPREWQERRGIGLSGGRLAFRGLKLARFTIELLLVDETDWADWHGWKDVVQRPPIGERPRALDVSHPQLADCGIGSIVIEDVTAPEPADETGLWVVEIKCIEHRPPAPAATVVDGSAAQGADRISEAEADVAAAAAELTDAMADAHMVEAGLR